MKPCFKRHVIAQLITKAGEVFTGSNWILNDEVKSCPRIEGEDYKKCQDICDQKFHAERAAISNCIMAGKDPMSGTLYLSGHYKLCKKCESICKKWGIKVNILGLELEEKNNVLKKFGYFPWNYEECRNVLDKWSRK